MTADKGGEFAAVGGHLVLDLVNTVAWRLDPDRRTDLLVDPAAGARWVRQFRPGQLADEPITDGLLVAVKRVREDAYRALLEQDRTAAERLFTGHRRWLGNCVPEPTGTGWTLTATARTPLLLAELLAHQGFLLLLDPAAGLVKQCADDACGWVFLDQSRRHNRQWCSAADCGTRNRSRRYYQRSTGR